MMLQLFLQLVIATANPFSTASITSSNVRPVSPVVAGPNDHNALDILNNTRPDILRRGVTRGCPVVTNVYVNGKLRQPPAVNFGLSTATIYVAGDTVMVMLPPSVADALRTIPADDVRDIEYSDCTASDTPGNAKNTLYVTTRE